MGSMGDGIFLGMMVVLAAAGMIPFLLASCRRESLPGACSGAASTQDLSGLPDDSGEEVDSMITALAGNWKWKIVFEVRLRMLGSAEEIGGSTS